MKQFIKKIRKAFAIHIISKRLDKENGHWSDDWEKAEYKIKKYTNANGYCKYYPYRTLNGKTELASLASRFGYNSEEDARKAIENCKAFHQEEWNRHYTGKTKWINVC